MATVLTRQSWELGSCSFDDWEIVPRSQDTTTQSSSTTAFSVDKHQNATDYLRWSEGRDMEMVVTGQLKMLQSPILDIDAFGANHRCTIPSKARACIARLTSVTKTDEPDADVDLSVADRSHGWCDSKRPYCVHYHIEVWYHGGVCQLVGPDEPDMRFKSLAKQLEAWQLHRDQRHCRYLEAHLRDDCKDVLYKDPQDIKVYQIYHASDARCPRCTFRIMFFMNVLGLLGVMQTDGELTLYQVVDHQASPNAGDEPAGADELEKVLTVAPNN